MNKSIFLIVSFVATSCAGCSNSHKPRQPATSNPEIAFSNIDTDHDGYISRSEWLSAYVGSATKSSDETLRTEANRQFDMFDKNRDARITFKEFEQEREIQRRCFDDLYNTQPGRSIDSNKINGCKNE